MAFENMGGNAVQWIDEAVRPLAEMIKGGIDAIGDMIIGAFDKVMTAAVSKAGDMAGKMGDMARTATAAVKSAGDFSAFSGKSDPSPEPQLARSKQIEQDVGTPSVPEHVKSAVASLGIKNSEIVASTHVAESSLGSISPSAVGYSGQNQSQGITFG